MSGTLANLAAQYFAVSAQALDCLRLARQYPTDTTLFVKCAALSAGMMREARGWRTALPAACAAALGGAEAGRRGRTLRAPPPQARRADPPPRPCAVQVQHRSDPARGGACHRHRHHADPARARRESPPGGSPRAVSRQQSPRGIRRNGDLLRCCPIRTTSTH